MTHDTSNRIPLPSRMQNRTVTLGSENHNAVISFNLDNVAMTEDQKAIVLKLFNQHPIAIVTEEEHRHTWERGKEGPASQYLSRDEFERIRELGVRLGTSGSLVATVCDFCLHCVKLEDLLQDLSGPTVLPA